VADVGRIPSDALFGGIPDTKGSPVVASMSFNIQLGTAFDAGQSLVWTLVTGESLRHGHVFVPRPRKYRTVLPKLAASYDGVPASPSELDAMFGIGSSDPDAVSLCVLRAPALMQSKARFCPDGCWFPDLGARLARYTGILSPAPVTFLLSLRNPAVMLSEAWASGKYPGFDSAPPDPFALRWASVLADVRAQCPDARIVVWRAEDMAAIWNRVLTATINGQVDISTDTQIQFAKSQMQEDGWASLDTYLAAHPDIPDTFRTRVIGMFIGRFPKLPDVAIPGWSSEAELLMDDHYADDLDRVAQMEGVTLIRGLT
jgi:hypothetical protein